MITKAFVVKRSTLPGEENKYVVRIPIIHGVEGTPQYTPDDLLPAAPVCSLAGTTSIANPGDVVYVAFENDSYDNPVIIGQLLHTTNSTTAAAVAGTTVDLVVRSLRFSDDFNKAASMAKLPEQTTVGEVSAQEIAFLRGLTSNIQSQLDALSERINALSE